MAKKKARRDGKGPGRRRGPGQPSKDERAGIEEAKGLFLDNLAEMGWTKAAKFAGISAGTPSVWRRIDPEFKKRMDALNEDICEALERIGDEAIRGERVMERSAATLLIFRLKALKPKVYRDRVSLEHSGPNNGPIQHEQVGDASVGRRMLAEYAARIPRK